MAQMLSDQNMGAAWKHVKANKGAPGIDNMSIEAFEPFALAHWQRWPKLDTQNNKVPNLSLIKKQKDDPN